MKKEIQSLLNSINHSFDKVHHVVKKDRSRGLNVLQKTLLANSKEYKEKINKVQKLYSTKKTKIIIEHKYFELVACSIGAKGKKYSSFGTSYRILPINKYLKQLRCQLNRLGTIGTTSTITNSSNIIGKCAEVKATNNLLKRESLLEVNDIVFTKAIRPRTLEKILRCKNCIKIFGHEN